jgi:glyoxylase-like metal-dependent hydrolase (beta-lactamase superfamily II)
MTERRFGPVRFLPGPNRGKYPHCHSIYVEGAGLLIDPGSDRGRLRRLRAEEGVREVWLSHWHEDHIAHLDLFDDLPLRMSRQDAPMLADMDAFLDAYGMERPDFRRHWRGLLESEFHFRPRAPAGFLEAGEVLRRGPVTIEVLHTPGHTPGHLAFLFREPAVLFMGDYDLTAFGPWYGDRDASVELTEESVARLRRVPAQVRLAGHEQGVFETEPGELWDAYLGVIYTRERRLLEFLEAPRTLEEIVAAWIVYGRPREPAAYYAFGEEAIMGKHLRRLMSDGRVARCGDRYARAAGITPRA